MVLRPINSSGSNGTHNTDAPTNGARNRENSNGANGSVRLENSARANAAQHPQHTEPSRNALHESTTGTNAVQPPHYTEPHGPTNLLCLNCGNDHHDWKRCVHTCQWCHTQSHAYFCCDQKGANWYQWIEQEAAAGREYCLTCGSTGHGFDRCLERCQFCWTGDHPRRTCPERFACIMCGEMDCHWQTCSRACRWCDTYDHRGAICGMRCVKKVKACKRCIGLGHDWENCTERCRYCLTFYHPGEICPDRLKCLTCGKEGCHYMRCKEVCRHCKTRDHPLKLCPFKDTEREEEEVQGEFHNGYQKEPENGEQAE